SLRAKLRGGATDGPAPAGSGPYDVTAAAIAGRPADPCARLQRSRCRAVAVSDEHHPCANDQRYGDGRYRPTSFGNPRAPSDASHSWHGASWKVENSELGFRDRRTAVYE